MAAAETTRCGYVALIGAPNAGKSTLLNTLVGSKIAIVTPKVQTTRSRIIGIALHGTAQIIFVDTPGIFEPRRRLDRAMVRAAWVGANDADVRVLLVDATRAKNGVADGESARIVADLRRTGTDAILALNKIDAVAKNSLLALAENSSKDGPFLAVFMISALAGDGLADLVDDLVARLPEGPWLYPEDQIAEVPLRQLAAEITREKLYLALRQELPYAATVETESWKERDDGSVRIEQIIYIERDSQKAIVLGKGGRQIKEIGAASRIELEQMLERRVHLFIFVKVRPKWGDDPERYREIGLEFPGS
ncbi:MAG TPA: GTPase Era [Alphaproteobacteria bacterium]|nr:GTPase Era [Alphaproteobacteria bacterium]